MYTQGFTQLYNILNCQVFKAHFSEHLTAPVMGSHTLTDSLAEEDAINLLLIQKAI